MREISLKIGNFVLLALTVLLMGNLQVSLWLQIFGHFPAPHIWLPVLVYTSVYRKLNDAIIAVYIFTVILTPLTSMPFGLILLTNMIVMVGIYLFKQRVYWPGSTYFMILSGLASAAFPILHFILSLIAESNSISEFLFFEWIMKSLLTMLVALPLYLLLYWIDRITKKEWPSEIGGLVT